MADHHDNHDSDHHCDGSSNDNAFPTGSSVPFPYETPYPQQVDLMDTLLRCLQKRSNDKTKNARAAVMLLESPTGTGKSLSLACAAMAWLRHQEQCDLQQDDTITANDTNTATTSDWWNAWVSPEQSQDQKQQRQVRQCAKDARNDLTLQLSQLQSKLFISRSNLGAVRERRENMVRTAVTMVRMQTRTRQRPSKRQRQGSITAPKNDANKSPLPDFCVPQDYRSDEDKTPRDDSGEDSDQEARIRRSSERPSDKVAASWLLEGARLDGSRLAEATGNGTRDAVGSVPPGSGLRKIFYAARTHSQLSQFVGELRRTHWGSNNNKQGAVRVVALGGRQLLCGNNDLRKRVGTSEAAISEACLDFQKDKAKTKSSLGCPLLVSREAVSTLALHILAHPSDIEDAARLGEASHTCSYYASRESLAAAEVVVLPYSMLLSQQARSAVGLSLKESLVIIDEAHNLPEALRSLHSCRLGLPVAEAALAQLAAYTAKYVTRLAGRNLYYLGQIRKCLLAFVKHLQSKPDTSLCRMMSSAELLIHLKLDNVNIFKILRYLERSRLSQKLLGFVNSSVKDSPKESENHHDTGLSKHVSALSVVQSFLEKLTSSSNEGKVVTDWPSPVDLDSRSSMHATRHATLRYVLLHPSLHFQNVLDEAYAVALVGGTLRPFAHMAAELLGSDYILEAARADSHMKNNMETSASTISSSLTAFTCDHVVPSSHVQMEFISMGPTRQKLDFRHSSRMTHAVCDELGCTIENICKVVPFGIVIFLPSYSYEAHLVRRWKATGMLQNIQCLKKLHREPKHSQQVEVALDAYSRDAQSSSGALLLSVVGGKMSEGINFANDMARCVMVVGLPYADITDPELKEKMRTMDQAAATNQAGITGQSYYHNLCMRAVNQSIGRAIRHANDFAAIVLADFRYSADPKIAAGLPQWLRRSSNTFDKDASFNSVLNRLGDFFDKHDKRLG